MSGNAPPGPLNGIIDANIIWRAFTAHLMFHERTKWIVYAGASVASVLLQDSVPHASDKSISKAKNLQLTFHCIPRMPQYVYMYYYIYFLVRFNKLITFRRIVPAYSFNFQYAIFKVQRLLLIPLSLVIAILCI